MKRLLVTVSIIVTLVGCGGGTGTTREQAMEKMALGLLQREEFVTADYPKFKESYDTLRVDEQVVEMIKALHADVHFAVVLGTWCGDSKREVPRFLKIVDATAIPAARIAFFGVDRSKKSDLTEQYKIERVPTFIVFKKGTEVGRIVESPKTTLEADLLSILADALNK